MTQWRDMNTISGQVDAGVRHANSLRRRAVAGAFVGTAIEWYDFFIFGTAAALVFGPVFFPSADATTGVLASFATFWVGFVARPIGGVLFGHLGDRFGRKRVLVATLFLMGVGTTAIGFLPSYAQVGVLAPILLIVLRALQGLAVGGEWAGATLMATESADEARHTSSGMWVQQGSPAGSILATLVFLLVGGLPDDQFLSWGWRVPFLLSAVLLVVALLIRSQVAESQDFLNTQRLQQIVSVPVVHVFRVMPALVFFGVLASALGIAAAFFQNTFLVSWWTKELGNDRQQILMLVFLMAIVQFGWQPVASFLSGVLGRDRMMFLSIALSLVATVPYFVAILSGNMVFLAFMMALLIMGGSGYYALLASFLSSLFPPNVRFTGVALANGLCAVFIGGSTPLIAQAILSWVGPWGVAFFYVAISFLTVAGIWGARRARRGGWVFVN